MFSGQGADCWNLVDGLGRAAGRRRRSRSCCPVRASTSRRWTAAGDLADGHLLHRLGQRSPAEPARRRSRTSELESTPTTYQTKACRVRPAETEHLQGLRDAGLLGLMTCGSCRARSSSTVATSRGQSISEAYRSDRRRAPRSAVDAADRAPTAPAPYIAVCSSEVTVEPVGRRAARSDPSMRVAQRPRPRRRHGAAARPADRSRTPERTRAAPRAARVRSCTAVRCQ